MAERPYRISVVELTRIVRFHLEGSSPSRCNGYAGRPALSGIVPMVKSISLFVAIRIPKPTTCWTSKNLTAGQRAHLPSDHRAPTEFKSRTDLFAAFQATDDFPHELISIKPSTVTVRLALLGTHHAQ